MGAYLGASSLLLPPDVREDDAVVLDAKISEVESDILDVYRMRDGEEVHVMLYGYADTDPEEIRDAFAEAMQRVVARVVTHRMRHLDMTGGVESEANGRRSRSYRDGFDPAWPKAWQAPLVKYDLRTRAYVI